MDDRNLSVNIAVRFFNGHGNCACSHDADGETSSRSMIERSHPDNRLGQFSIFSKLRFGKPCAAKDAYSRFDGFAIYRQNSPYQGKERHFQRAFS